ncbi:AraC family transcriptional regulator [Caulobacter endophyticus]|uniref:AraC family transcriptional regulator n=1 Tax=Caulobacter endophyticus TaxID=2172652 RepID=UPI00240EF00C|nr:AraC family transcriptional regulator [Caulobacter endophyticus]MDG2530686.1 AraC family transcriptional regulator [Caulobacter endophyticus]
MIIQESPADPLSDVLALAGARAFCSVRLEAGGDWALRFDPAELKFNAVRRGACWLLAEGLAPRRIEAGDCFVVRRPFVLTSDPALPPVDAAAVFADGRAARYGEGDDVDILGGAVSFARSAPFHPAQLLPPVLVVGAGEEAPIAWLLDQLDREWRGGAAGALLACNDLLRLMFVHVLRVHLASAGPAGLGWLAGLSDPPVAAALKAIHAQPARAWRLEELADLAGMSRSSFAERFRRRTGQPPIDYAARWRMQLAAARLLAEPVSVSIVAQDLGFLSDSAFGAAFRRVHGVSPGRYRRHAARA